MIKKKSIPLFLLKLKLSILLLLLSGFGCMAQYRYTLKIISVNAANQAEINYLIKKRAVALKFTDSLSCLRTVRLSLDNFYEQGYLAASYDSIIVLDSTMIAYLKLGEKYKWAQLKFAPDKEYLMRILGTSSFTKNIFTPKQFAALNKKVLQYYENNGYPFAAVQLKTVEIKNQSISAFYDIKTNNRIAVDSIHLTGTAKISKTILYNYLSIEPKDLYNESLIRRISARIKEVNFVTQYKSPQVVFNPEGCYIDLYLNDKKSSQIDGILGIMPPNVKGGKTTLTGDFRMRLQNSFAKGELIDLHWERPQAATQVLNVKFIYPFLFKTPFGLDAALNLRKQDSTYLNVLGNLGINYFLPGGNYIKFYVESFTSNLLSTKGLETLTTLPPYADIKKRLGGIGIRKEQLDYRYNPRKGYSIEATASAGLRTIEPNSKIKPELYDSVELKTTQYVGQFVFNNYFPLGNRNVINLGLQGAALFSNNIFQNELYFIGGLTTLRGFDDQSIAASQYLIAKCEYRFILDQGSYLLAFFNAAHYQNKSDKQDITDTPFGFGVGLSFETRLGVFSFNYALGKQFDNPIYIRSAKIHFGIISYF